MANLEWDKVLGVIAANGATAAPQFDDGQIAVYSVTKGKKGPFTANLVWRPNANGVRTLYMARDSYYQMVGQLGFRDTT